MQKPKMVVIVGPTASGKSDLAVTLAKKFNGEVISADSRQVYRELNIGTGKITKKEMRGVKHHLLDVANPKTQFSVSDFVSRTNQTIVKIVLENKLPIICGGTGFYIDALLGDKQIPEVPPNPKLRKQLENKPVEELFKMLQKLDPERAKNIDSKNPRRLVRAIEICKALGSVPKQTLNPKSDSPGEALAKRGIRKRFDILKIGIAPLKKKAHPLAPSPREGGKEERDTLDERVLKQRINNRLTKRIKLGMIAEAKKLHQKGLSYKRMREFGLEYRRLADFLSQKISKQELTSLLQKEIWQYAKRQMTWFKRDKNTIWFTLSKVEGFTPQIGLAEKQVKSFLK